MFERFDHANELFEYQLGSALTMEHDSLEMLEELEAAAHTVEVRGLFAHHQDETRHQIRNLEQAFAILGMAPGASPSAATKGLMKEGRAMLAKTGEPLADLVAVNAALGTEHFEISAYETLIIAAQAMGATEVQTLLQENLEQERHTSEELSAAARRLAPVVAGI